MRDMKTPRKNISLSTLRQRDDEEAGIFVRWQKIELHREQPEDKNKVRVIASTDNPVDWGYFREILIHTPNAVDVRAAATCLFNHNRNAPIGGIESCEVDGKTMTAVLDIDPEARAKDTGMRILEGIRKGWIRGVSIGYQYDMERDAQIVTENDVTTVTVNKWRLREISITPTQADVTAQVTRTQETIKTRSAKSTTHTEEKAMNEAQRAQLRLTLRAMGLSEAEINDIMKRDALTMETGLDAANAIVASRATATKHANEVEAARAEEQARCLRISEMARTFNLDPKKYVEIKDEEKSRAEMAKDHAENLKNAGKGTSKGNVRKDGIEVGVEECEKVRDCAVNALLSRTQGMKVGEDKLQGNPFAGRRVTDIARLFAQRMGHNEAGQWSDREAAAFALGVGRGVQEIRARNANVFTGGFDSYVLANVMDKAVVAGFKAFEQNMTYNLWTRIREVSDFKQVNGAALDVGNLVQTPEGSPFPELVKAEFGYVAALQMWGVTASLNEQVIVNDDLGEFFSQVFRAGAIAQRTIEKEVYAQLEATTWTNNTSSGSGLGTGAAPTPGNLDVVRKAFRNKTGPAGEKLGNVPKFLIHAMDIALPVDIALGRVINYAGVQASVRSSSMIPIETPFLTGTATTYYLAGDPAIVDTMVILMLAGQMVPRVEEYDAGAVAAKKWKISLPFAAKSVSTSVPLAAGSTAFIAPGLQQATV